MADEVLTVEGVAARYGVNPQTVRRWLASGKVRGFRVGPTGVWRVRA